MASLTSNNPNPGMMSPRKGMGYGKVDSGAGAVKPSFHAGRPVTPQANPGATLADSARTCHHDKGHKDGSRRDALA